MTGTHDALVWVLSSLQMLMWWPLGWQPVGLLSHGGTFKKRGLLGENEALEHKSSTGILQPQPLLCLFISWPLWCEAALCHQTSLPWCVAQSDRVQGSQIKTLKPKLTFHPLRLFISNIFGAVTVSQHMGSWAVSAQPKCQSCPLSSQGFDSSVFVVMRYMPGREVVW